MSDDAVERLRAARRILVVGPSGGGKTQLALRLGRALELPVVHLDAQRWQPGWRALGDAEWRAVVRRLVAQPTWIMDGTYERTLDLRAPPADAVVLLEPPRVVCLAGVCARRLRTGDRPRVDAPPGQPLDRALLRYVWRYESDTRRVVMSALERYGSHLAVVRLPSRRAARGLAERLEARAGASPGVTGRA